MRYILLYLSFAVLLCAGCGKDYKALGNQDVEYLISTGGPAIVSYINEEGHLVTEEVDGGFYHRMSKPRGVKLYAEIRILGPNQRVIARLMKDRKMLDFKEVTGSHHIVEVSE